MQVVEIRGIDGLEEIRADYEAVYSVDSLAGVVVSWIWLRGWLEMIAGSWVILGTRADEKSPYIAFLLLKFGGPGICGVRVLRLLDMGGRPDVCLGGFLCSPGVEDEALATLAEYVGSHMQWDMFSMKHIGDPRLSTFLSGFPQSRYNIQTWEGWPRMCLNLPESWDDYQMECLGHETRSALRKRMRVVDKRGDVSMTQTTADTLEKDINALLHFWQARWGPQPLVDLERRMLRYCFEHDNLWLGVLSLGGVPIGGLCGIIDWRKKVYTAYITGYDKEHSNLSPGKVVFGTAIRWAIENGLQVFDFTVGNDAYKAGFGAQAYETSRVSIARRSLRPVIACALFGEPRGARNILKRSVAAARQFVSARTRLARALKRLGRESS